MKNLRGSLIVGVVCLIVAVGCKKKESEPAAGSGSGSAAMGSGSAMAGSGSAEAAGSGSAMAGSGSAMAGSGSAEAAGSGSAMAGSGSAMAGSGSSAAAEPPAPAADSEGHRKWDCKKTCKLALKCKAAPGYHNEKECDQDCASLAKDKGGRYARGSVVGAAYYTCTAKAKDCAGIKKCDHDVEHAK